jgi:hypothetical protein
MPNHHINLHPQISDWTAPTATGANGSITAVLCEKGLPVWDVTDATVISPNAVTMNIRSGGLDQDHHVYLHATTGAQYWKFTIVLGELSRTWYFTWPDSAHTDFADINFIDPYDYTGA